jgi:hypothetical protein
MAEQWFSIVEYARRFNLSDMTVRRRIKTGKLHAVLKEGKYFIPVPVGVPQHSADESHFAETLATHSQQHAVPPPPKRQPAEMTVIKGHPQAHKTYQPPVPAPERHLPAPPPESVHSSTHLHAHSHAHAQHGGQPPHVQHVAHGHVVSGHQPAHGHGSQSHGHAPRSHGHTQPRQQPELPHLDDGDMAVPSSLRRSLAGQETSLVDTRALLAFCEASLRKIGETERRQAEKFKSKLEALEASLANKDMEILQLRQKVEDLQLLVRFLDNKKRPA